MNYNYNNIDCHQLGAVTCLLHRVTTHRISCVSRSLEHHRGTFSFSLSLQYYKFTYYPSCQMSFFFSFFSFYILFHNVDLLTPPPSYLCFVFSFS
jgi:hypothetical protein